jgi:hypothetical protein
LIPSWPAGLVWAEIECCSAQKDHKPVSTSSAKQTTGVNFSQMSPKLLLTYPHKVEDFAMASLFLRLMLLKVLPNQLKIFVNLTFFTKSLTILFVLIYYELRVPVL